MMLPLLQIAMIATVVLYLGRWQSRIRTRNEQSWDSLVARLRPDWSARELGDHSLWQESLNATQEDAWLRMEGPRGLWAIHQNAQVMLEMADYAARNSDSIDRELLATLRSNALQIRACVYMALGQYAFSKASEGVRVNAFRSASTYARMAAQLTEFLHDSAPGMVPDFVAAM
jgi:hypothetical protein